MYTIYRLAAVAILCFNLPALADDTDPNPTDRATAGVSEERLIELTGYMAAQELMISQLYLDADGVEATTAGFRAALAGKPNLDDIAQTEIQATLAQARKRLKAIRALPKLDAGQLNIIGKIAARQSAFKQLDFGAAEVDQIVKGYVAGSAAHRVNSDIDAMLPALQEFIRQRVAAKADRRRADNIAFLPGLESRGDVEKTESGLYFKVLRPGTGRKPNLSDSVLVHYRGTLIDGTQFDSSYDRKRPTRFALNQVVHGFAEGLTKVGAGGKIIIYVPSELGYGYRVPPNSVIKAGDVLVFETELLSID